MDYVLVSPGDRGQITLPKKYRDKYGIRSGFPVKVVDSGFEIKILPFEDGNVILPKYSRHEYLKVLDEISAYMETNGPLWTKDDDRLRAVSLKKEKLKYKKLNW